MNSTCTWILLYIWVEWVSENVMGCDHWFFSLVTWLKMKSWKITRKCYSLVQWIFAGFVESTGNEDSNDQSIDSDNTSHDHGDDGFHNQLRSHDTHSCNTCSWLGGSVSCTEGYISEMERMSSLVSKDAFQSFGRIWQRRKNCKVLPFSFFLRW